MLLFYRRSDSICRQKTTLGSILFRPTFDIELDMVIRWAFEIQANAYDLEELPRLNHRYMSARLVESELQVVKGSISPK